MSASSATTSTHSSTTADAFLTGVMVMLLINVVQRVIGLARNIGFSLYLTDDQLGLWSLANSFFIIAPPFIVLGLPGSFGKFVEHYRQQGCLRVFIVRIAVVCTVVLGLFAVALLLVPETVAKALYGESQTYTVILWTGITLAILTVHNFVYEVVLALRQLRLSSLMQFANSAAFCAFGIAGIYLTRSWSVLLPSYSAACLIAIALGTYGLLLARREFHDQRELAARQMWKRIVPFAIAVWLTNLLTNAFELSDRYMLLHFASSDPSVGQSLVGQFYCGRIIPNLLLSLAMMLSGMYLPFLSAEWERKQFHKIGEGMNRMLISMSLTFTGLAMFGLAAAPVLFQWVLGGRFDPAFEILPIGLMQATWSGLTMMAATYLMCAEKGRQNALMLAIGLGLNIALNWPMIHWFGLFGAALATTTSNAVLLMLVLWRLHREGCAIQKRTVLLCCLPMILAAGVYAAGIIFLVLAIICGRTNWLLTDTDRRSINQWVLPKFHKFGMPLRTVWLDR